VLRSGWVWGSGLPSAERSEGEYWAREERARFEPGPTAGAEGRRDQVEDGQDPLAVPGPRQEDILSCGADEGNQESHRAGFRCVGDRAQGKANRICRMEGGAVSRRGGGRVEAGIAGGKAGDLDHGGRFEGKAERAHLRAVKAAGTVTRNFIGAPAPTRGSEAVISKGLGPHGIKIENSAQGETVPLFPAPSRATTLQW